MIVSAREEHIFRDGLFEMGFRIDDASAQDIRAMFEDLWACPECSEHLIDNISIRWKGKWLFWAKDLVARVLDSLPAEESVRVRVHKGKAGVKNGSNHCLVIVGDGWFALVMGLWDQERKPDDLVLTLADGQ